MAQMQVLLPQPEATSDSETEKALKRARERDSDFRRASLPSHISVDISALLSGEEFRVTMPPPTNEDNANQLAKYAVRIREQGKVAVNAGIEECYVRRLAEASFPKGTRGYNLAVKWINYDELSTAEDRRPELDTSEKIELAYLMGNKTFSNDRGAAARYSANCFGLTEQHEKFQAAYDFFRNYHPSAEHR